MVLSDIRSYCAETGQVSLQELANRFDTDPEAIRGMVEVLVQKGMLRCLTETPEGGCGKGCCGCTNSCAPLAGMSDAVYQWVGRSRRPLH
ncbi:hypothetical protein CCR90_00630 [Rhodovulum sulfidophilum]|uniref:Transcriptional regulator HTH-type FeoC domain-containing protein n=1 Tax=Rhodovulum sulfidophilum TaxID=35806 RepID=A0A0D6AXI5_RHOSU|nr:FeoC-like transcriptional regulator [Rhodovulum sulfidophilum]MBK5922302.1 hypothetical protein [Rhodovulum sulfidophilum]MBL3585125.1 hypothetical protein [Rhodovulum sulfidophilum]BAQ67330.1 hypothetical protein NHU_00159 [Rhodovulum sulfidophilum]